MTEAQQVVLSGDEQNTQRIRAIRMSNRLSIAQIRLKRADRFSESLEIEMKEINTSIFSLSDSLLLGEDVRSNLDIIDDRVAEFEHRVLV